jgi:hypothetical protein
VRLEDMIHDSSPEAHRAAAADPRLTEELALALLDRRDLADHAIAALARNASAMKHRKVIIAVVQHPRTPRHVSLPVVRRLYTFELMQLALTPTLAADLKLVTEEVLISRLDTISAGERVTLARRASSRVAAALLLDADARIVEAALDNSRLTEVAIVQALLHDEAPPGLPRLVCTHNKWSLRRDIKAALLRNQHTPLARAIAIAHSLPPHLAREALEQSRLPEKTKQYLLEDVQRAAERKQKHKRASL